MHLNSIIISNYYHNYIDLHGRQCHYGVSVASMYITHGIWIMAFDSSNITTCTRMAYAYLWFGYQWINETNWATDLSWPYHKRIINHWLVDCQSVKVYYNPHHKTSRCIQLHDIQTNCFANFRVLKKVAV